MIVEVAPGQVYHRPVPPDSYLPIIERLASLHPQVYIFGGIAEDALLDGSITRPHGDVDVLVGRATLDLHLTQLGSIGFPDFEVFFEPARNAARTRIFSRRAER